MPQWPRTVSLFRKNRLSPVILDSHLSYKGLGQQTLSWAASQLRRFTCLTQQAAGKQGHCQPRRSSQAWAGSRRTSGSPWAPNQWLAHQQGQPVHIGDRHRLTTGRRLDLHLRWPIFTTQRRRMGPPATQDTKLLLEPARMSQAF